MIDFTTPSVPTCQQQPFRSTLLASCASTTLLAAAVAAPLLVGSASPMLGVGERRARNLARLRWPGRSLLRQHDWKGRAGFQLASSSGAGSSFTTTSRQPNAAAKLQARLDLSALRGVEAKLTYDAALAPGYVSQSLIGRLAYVF